jgi:hypothetical protein
MGKITMTTTTGKKQLWRTAARADRKLLKLLVPKIQTLIDRLRGTLPPEDAHYWSCPSCWGRVVPNPEACDGCGTRFRTAKTATLLSLAFPGAGLFYAQRPILGFFDLLGELFMFGVFATWLAVSSSIEEAVFLGVFGGCALLFTKAESIHVSRIMVRRARAIDERASAGWRKFGWTGAFVTVAALLLAGGVTGSLAVTLARDIDFDAEELGWISSRSATEFYSNEDGDQRSQWDHVTSGQEVVVYAYLLDQWTEFEMFVDDYVASMGNLGFEYTVYDAGFSPGFDAFGWLVTDPSAPEVEWRYLNYLIWDEESRAVHHVFSSVPIGYEADAMLHLEALFETAYWIPAVDVGS